MILHILANPNVGSQQAEKMIEKIKRDYPQVKVRVYLTQREGDEGHQVRNILQQFSIEQDKLLILGGDGTLSKVLDDWPAHLPFAYYPTGSGNDFAKSMLITDVDDVMTALLKGKMSPISVLKTSFGTTINSMDMGFAAQVIARSGKTRIKKWLNYLKVGKLTYLIMAIRSLLDVTPLSVTIQLEQEHLQLHNLFFLSLANSPYFGGGIMIWPDASAYKQQVDVVYIENGPLYRRVLALLDLVFKRHHQSKYVKHVQAQTVYLEADRELPLQSDGEMLTGRAFELTCQERKIYL